MANPHNQKLLVALAVQAVTTMGFAQTYVQWTTASGGNDHYYALTPTATDWQVAETYAIAQGGHLASITSAGEQAFINATFLTGAFEQLPLWIGLTDIPNGVGSRNYTSWTTGEPLAFTNWILTSEPNNNTPGEDYVTINWNVPWVAEKKGTWNDTPLNGTTLFGGTTTGPYYGLIETAIPEPAMCAAVAGLAALGGASFFRRNRKSDCRK